MADKLSLLREAKVRFEQREKQSEEIILPLLREFSLLEDTLVRAFIQAVLCMAPDYFWTAPRVLGEGKGPVDELKEGGLVLHTRRAVKIIVDLLNVSGVSSMERDYIVGAMLIHDVFYYGLGEENFPREEDPLHPFYLDKILDREGGEKHTGTNGLAILPEEQRELILRLVRTHKGPYSIAPELEPQTPVEFLMFYANRLCSVPWVKVKI
jgi:hypothetical protein